MPLPNDGTTWPPPQVAAAYDRYRDWDAWYSGDPDRLRAVYANRATTGTHLPPSRRSQYAGGMVGWLSRWLWGQPPVQGQRDGRLHVPLPADLAATAANLVFSEPPALSSENPAVQARLDQLVEDGLPRLLLHAAEAASPLGDVYLRPVVDQDILPGRAFLAPVHADGAVPTIRWGRLAEVIFWSCVGVDGNTHWRLLEHHEPGWIRYGLYEGTATNIGRKVPFARLAEWAYLAGDGYTDGAQATGLDRLDVVRVPNSGPQRLWRTEGTLKYLGRSDFDGNEQWFDQLDSVWTSWMTELRLARARIMVPDYMLKSSGPGQGATFDADREVFTALTMLPNEQGSAAAGITMTSFAIRHAEHKATADAIVETALRHAGLSAQTLGEEGDIAVTATEVQARERQSFTTRGNRIQTWRPALAEAVELLLAVEAAQLRSTVPVEKPTVEFGDSVSEAPETLARTIQLLDAADAVSTETKVRMVHPDWDDPDVQAEVKRIREDAQASAVQDPGTFTGGPPDRPGSDGPEDPEA